MEGHRSWNEVQYEKRKDAVEAVIGKVQRAGISNLENDPWIMVVALGMLDVGGRIIDGMHLLCLASVHQSKGKAASAAADIKNVFASRGTDKVKKRARKSSAPASHLEFVAIAARGHECRRRSHR